MLPEKRGPNPLQPVCLTTYGYPVTGTEGSRNLIGHTTMLILGALQGMTRAEEQAASETILRRRGCVLILPLFHPFIGRFLSSVYDITSG